MFDGEEKSVTKTLGWLDILLNVHDFNTSSRLGDRMSSMSVPFLKENSHINNYKNNYIFRKNKKYKTQQPKIVLLM